MAKKKPKIYNCAWTETCDGIVEVTVKRTKKGALISYSKCSKCDKLSMWNDSFKMIKYEPK